jgi:flagellar hook-associated protein 1 FlgK
MSLFGTYQTARRALAAQTTALATTGDNIANAGVEGYARRRVDLRTLQAPGGGFNSAGHPAGGGVYVKGIERLRDEMVADSARRARAHLGAADERARTLGTLEGVFSTSSAGALPDVLGRFWNAWGDLSQDPENLAARRSVLSQATAAVDTIRQMGEGAVRMQEQTLNDLKSSVGDVNRMTAELAELNQSVRVGRSTGVPDLSSEDRRDVVLNELAELAPITIKRHDDGTATVSLDGMALVQADSVETLAVDETGAAPRVVFGSTDVALRATSGRLGARLEMLVNDIPETRALLDDFARQFVETVNAQHALGADQDGNAGGPFFDPAGVSSTSLSVALTNPRRIAAADAGQPAGDNANTLALAGLREPLDRAAVDLLSGLGAQVERSLRDQERQSIVVANLSGIEAGRSAVNMDEELTRMIAHQQSYGAAARLLTTAEEMMQTLLSI